ncbi:G2/M phase-specific E3 ubiquitin-protein ligase-like [Aegotheles albertisi]
MLCGRAQADPHLCGTIRVKQDICAHIFCVNFADGLFEKKIEVQGHGAIYLSDIRCAIEQAAQKHCFVCGNSGASISCQWPGCDRSFHLPCAVEGECITQYLPLFRGFCWEHRPKQAVEAVAEEDTTCLICLDLVGDGKSYSTMVCPVCKHAWFHRGCIQVGAVPSPVLAVHNGITRFQCPLCRNKDLFCLEMLTMGIRVPGRPWQLLLCSSCAAQGTHRGCSSLRNGRASWECDGCAGPGTASSASPNTPGQVPSGSSAHSPA